MNKYHARKVALDGYIFDSQAEARRYQELRLLEQAGEIEGLVVHPRYPLIVRDVNCGYYEADSSYWQPIDECESALVVEDVKSKPTRTAVYRLKKKLVKALYGIEIQEVTG